MSLSTLLSMSGNTTYAARDGEEAISMAEKVRPEVILLDLGLPKLDGFEVCRRFVEQAWGKEMVIVALTGWGHDEARYEDAANRLRHASRQAAGPGNTLRGARVARSGDARPLKMRRYCAAAARLERCAFRVRASTCSGYGFTSTSSPSVTAVLAAST